MPRRVISLEDDVIAVPNEAILYRRVVWSLIGGRERCSPGEIANLNGNCFADWLEDEALRAGFPRACMSVGVSTVLAEMGFSAEKMLEGYPGYGLACFSAADVRRLTKADGTTPCPQGVKLAPTEAEPWHGIVFDLSGARRSKAAKNAIARVASWVVPLIND